MHTTDEKSDLSLSVWAEINVGGLTVDKVYIIHMCIHIYICVYLSIYLYVNMHIFEYIRLYIHVTNE
jgi:hypothetical protein